MDDTVLFPSPNWFQSNGSAVSCDGWIVYGGTIKSLCVLEPLPPDSAGVLQGKERYQAHVLNKAHAEKIVCVDISPEWPQKRCVLAGSADGVVKQWTLEPAQGSMDFKCTHSHEQHKHHKEEVVGVGYCNNGYAVSVGTFGNIVKWDLNSNVVKAFHNVLKNFRPVSMACSPHINLNVAIGTKQGVVFVLDLNGGARLLYKVRGQDDEVLKVGWCPQYEVAVDKTTKESEKLSVATQRMRKIRREPESPEIMKALDERVKIATEKYPEGIKEFQRLVLEDETVEKVMHTKEVLGQVETNGKEPQEKGSVASGHPTETTEEQLVETNESLLQPAETAQSKVIEKPGDTNEESEKSEQSSIMLEKPAETIEVLNKSTVENKFDESGTKKTLPDDSFDESVVVPEDDMFDIYQDHEVEEFGHKKFQPVDIIVKIPSENADEDYLAECMKLKEDILKKKNEPESTIEDLVEALDQTHVESAKTQDQGEASQSGNSSQETNNTDLKNTMDEASSPHIHKHLLASIGRHGSVRIWSKTGKLVSSCAILNAGSKNTKNQRNNPTWATLLWYKPDILLLGDGKSQLLECNPLKIDSKNKLAWKVVHTFHKRGLYAIFSNVPRVQSPDMSADQSNDDRWPVWTASQDRNIIRYSMQKQQLMAVHNTCGGFLYAVAPCPYDARKVAISVGDGAVRVWETDTVDPDDAKLSHGVVTSYWNNVQGKVLTVAWHPTRENLLAFGTAESRVGMIDTSGKTEKPAKALIPATTGGVYSLSWGEGHHLYACGGGELVVYSANKPEDAPAPIKVEVEGQKWELTSAQWYPHALVVGSSMGGVAVLTSARPHHVVAANFLYSKMIHAIDWHPNEESPYKNLIAVCSLDKVNTIVILEYADKEDGSKQLSTWKTLSGHKGSVLRVVWNPHDDTLLLSTSHDGTVRVWNVVEGACVSLFSGHQQSTLDAAWFTFPQLGTKVLSGGADGCLRLWDTADHPPEAYNEPRNEIKKDRKKRSDKKKPEEPEEEGESTIAMDPQGATVADCKLKSSKKFLLPRINKQMSQKMKTTGPRIMMQKYLEKGCGDVIGTKNSSKATVSSTDFDLDYIKMFGSINDVNEILDGEMERHQDTGNMEAWMTLCILRGHIDIMMQYASKNDLLDPYLVSIAPCVSFKYWKDTTQLYLAQMDRLIAKGDETKLCENKPYGGPVYRKVSMLLSLHDVKGAVNVLADARLFKEAYILCRTRYMESIAELILKQWAEDSDNNGCWTVAAVCYIALGNLSQAATALAKSMNEECLSLAADLAKVAGQTIFADHIQEKRELLITNQETTEIQTEELAALPSRVDLIVSDKEHKVKGEDQLENKKSDSDVTWPKDAEDLLKELDLKMRALMKDSQVQNDEQINGDENGVGADKKDVVSEENIVDSNKKNVEGIQAEVEGDTNGVEDNKNAVEGVKNIEPQNITKEVENSEALGTTVQGIKN